MLSSILLDADMAGERPLVLVTGASGFIATHIVQQLIDTGKYRVRGTVRSAAKARVVRDVFLDQLHLVEADLTKNDGWIEAVDGCTYIIHVASPLPGAQSTSEAESEPQGSSDIIYPAVDGTRRVLQASVASRTVKRFILTSSVCAIAGTTWNGETYTEEDWPDPGTLTSYARGKTLAEKTAWDFVNSLPESKRFKLVVINPSLVLGPLITPSICKSLQIVKKFLEHSIRGVPRLQFNITDVRDVAKAHLLAITSEKAPGNRIIVNTEAIWMRDISQIIKGEFSSQGYSVSTLQLPKFILWFASRWNSSLQTVLSLVGKRSYFSTSKMKEILGITPIPVRDSVIDTCYSLIDNGHVVRKRKYRGRSDTGTATSTAAELG